jgi:hypothetical protein
MCPLTAVYAAPLIALLPEDPSADTLFFSSLNLRFFLAPLIALLPEDQSAAFPMSDDAHPFKNVAEQVALSY